MSDSNDRSPMPAGYELVWIDGATVRVILPFQLARERRRQQEEARRDDKLRSLEEAKSEEEHLQTQEAVEAQVAPAATTASAAAAAKVEEEEEVFLKTRGLLRVLSDSQIQTAVDLAEDLTRGGVDNESRQRAKALAKKLVMIGPYRRVARADDWREKLLALRADLPHFTKPIDHVFNTLAMSDVSGMPTRIPPMLLSGPPGLGKTYFSRRLAETLGTPHAFIGFNQPSAGVQMLGSDKHWANTTSGMLFNLICLGEHANPVVLLDEIDKPTTVIGRNHEDPLSQLLGALEPETARRIRDISVDLEFDASFVTYVATANKIDGLSAPLLSRFEVFDIEVPEPRAAIGVAGSVAKHVLSRLGLERVVEVPHRSLCVLAHMDMRSMRRALEKAVASTIASGRSTVGEAELWRAIGVEGDMHSLH